mgnify:CR=1 FL=1
MEPLPPDADEAPPPPPASPKPFGLGAAGLVFLVYLLAQFGGAAVAIIAVMIAAGGGKETIKEVGEPIAFLCAMIAGGVAVVLVTRSLWAGRAAAEGRRAFGLVGARRQTVLVALGGGVLLAAALLAFQVLVAPPAPDGDMGELSKMASTPGLPFVVFVLVAVVLAPPIEELLFRGVLLHGLSHRLGLVGAAAVTTAVFTLLHAAEAVHYPWAFVFIGGLGVGTAWLRIATGSILPAFALHVGYNGALTLVQAWALTAAP